MFEMNKENNLISDEEPPSRSGEEPDRQNDNNGEAGLVSFVKHVLKFKSDSSLRDTIEEYIEEENGHSDHDSVSSHEKLLISNILALRDLKAEDVMVPRADIIAFSDETSHSDILNLLSEKQYSRIPIYSETLDNVIGAIHIKDIMATLAQGKTINALELVREIPVVSPAMPVLDLLMQMRMTKKHMVLVIDEYGGVDGLVTIGDVIEAIVGSIDDEHDPEDHPKMAKAADGSIVADSRVNLGDFESAFGEVLSDEERDDNDTLGGLVFSVAGRVPVRGEIIKHDSGFEFEILEADPRRVGRLKILPPSE